MILRDEAKRVSATKLRGPVFLLMKRTGLGADDGLTKVSPFLIKKSIDCIGGAVKMCKKLKGGELLIQCFNLEQANKIITMKSLSANIFIDVTEHKTLNKTKGTIYTNEISYLSDAELLTELKDQNENIIEIKRFKRRDDNTKALTNEDSGLYLLTFNCPELPERVHIGYNSVQIRDYIPNPVRCFKCFAFGHVADNCSSQTKLCPHCSGMEHTETNESGKRELCSRPAKCVNCKEAHNSLYRKCEVFKKEFTIQKIRITQKKTMFEARKEYSRLNPLPTSFASTLKSCSCKCTCQDQKKTTKTTTSNTLINPMSEPAGPSSTIATLKVKQPDGSNIRILPKNVPKRLLKELARSNKSKKSKQGSQESLSMETSGMNNDSEERIDSSDE